MKLTSKRHPDNQPVKAPASVYDVPLPDGLYVRLRAVCKSCGNGYNYDGDPKFFDEDMSYCGRSHRCCP